MLLPDTFIDSLRTAADPSILASVPGGKATLYGTVYGYLTQYYLGQIDTVPASVLDYVGNCQRPDGLFAGEELTQHFAENKLHSKEHVLLHSTCTALPFYLQFSGKRPRPLTGVHKYTDVDYLDNWLNERDMRDAWLEGNNLLFIGQLLVYLRDVEQHPGAAAALDHWFGWLDRTVDPATGLWGTDGHCSPHNAMCGGYHQLLVYYQQERAVKHPEALVDTTLALQEFDGGFSPRGGGGACEDVDAVDILINMYKRHNYRRGDILLAVRRVKKLILSTQNPDGGFPYKRGARQSHMGIPGTEGAVNQSTAFGTWFRLHTLALIAEILPDDPDLADIDFRFSEALSMGWHDTGRRAESVMRNALAELGNEAAFLARTAPSYVILRLKQLKGKLTR